LPPTPGRTPGGSAHSLPATASREPTSPHQQSPSEPSKKKKLVTSLKTRVMNLKSTLASSVSRDKRPEERHAAANAAADAVKAQYGAAITEQLRTKTLEMCDWDLADMERRLRMKDSTLWEKIRPRTTDIVGGTLVIRDMSTVPEGDRAVMQLIKDFAEKKEVQENFIQTGTQDWYQKDRSEEEFVTVMKQMRTAKNLILQFHGRPVEPEPPSASGSS
jgi:hypothetical protein